MRLWSPTVAGLQTTSVTPSRPIAPGTSSQNAGRKVTCDRRAAAKAGDRERHWGHREGAEEAADVRTRELLADELTDPGDEEDDQEPARSAMRGGEGHGSVNAEHDDAEPWRPPAEKVDVIVVQDVGPRRTGQLRAGDDPEGEQQQLEAAEDEPARAGNHLARCEFDGGGRQYAAGARKSLAGR
jgi:hypothetical protein